jgi:hypothetical protein
MENDENKSNRSRHLASRGIEGRTADDIGELMKMRLGESKYGDPKIRADRSF